MSVCWNGLFNWKPKAVVSVQVLPTSEGGAELLESSVHEGRPREVQRTSGGGPQVLLYLRSRCRHSFRCLFVVDLPWIR